MQPGQPEQALFQNRDFLLFWASQIVSQFGNSVTNFALPVLVLAITGSPAQTGIVLVAQQVPYLILGLNAGVLVDRWNRRTTMIVAEMVRFIAIGAVAVAAYLGGLELWHLIVAAAVAGAAYTFFDVADNSAFPRLVGPEQLPRAASLSEGGSTAAELVGPVAAGLLLGLGVTKLHGAAFTFGLDALTFLVGIILLLGIRRPLQEGHSPGRKEGTVRQAVATGARYLFAHAELRILAMLNFIVCGLLGPISLLLLTRASLESIPTEQIGFMFTLGGIGGLVGAALTPALRARLDHRQVMVLACVVWAIAAGIAGIGSGPTQLIVSWMLFALMMPVYFTTLYARRVTLIPDDVLGRVNSIYRILAQAAPPLFILIAGFVLGWTGPTPVAWALSIIFISTAFVTWVSLASSIDKERRIDHAASARSVEDVDHLFAQSDSPWHTLTDEYRREMGAVVIAALPEKQYQHALDLGGGSGALTEDLARIAGSVDAVDGSAAADTTAATRVTHLPNVTVRQVALPPRPTFGGPYDLVAMSEVGHYLTLDNVHASATAIVESMAFGADLLLVHSTNEHPNHVALGTAVADVFMVNSALTLLSRDSTTIGDNAFEVALFRRHSHPRPIGVSAGA